MEVKVQGPEGSSLPVYSSEGAAGADLRAYLPQGSVLIGPQCRQLIPTGLVLAIPDGYEGQVRPRSGLALKYGVTVLNTPGTIDCDYRGPIGVILYNTGTEPFTINHGDRIAQLVVAPVSQANFLYDAVDLFETKRGQQGFGSTGTN